MVRNTNRPRPPWSRAAGAVALLVAVATLAAGHAASAAIPACEAIHDHYAGGSPRVQSLTIEGRAVFVLLPPDYDSTTAAFPVVYLLHGSSGNPDNYLVQSDLIAFTAALPVESQAIVVLPDGDQLPAWTDAPSAGRADETFFLHTLIPTIDARYRTLADGAHRAIAGFSLGGGAAFHLAARHPELFAAAASFSGADDFDPETSPRIALFVSGEGSYNATCAGDAQAVNRLGPTTDVAAHSLFFHNASPTDLAGNLSHTAVTLFAGNGMPCPGDPAKDATLLALEADDHAASGRFDQALSAAAVPHTYDEYGCGGHTYAYVQRDVHAWWPTMTAAFGRPTPAAFDYRTADASGSAWGWSFRADPGRAGEFMDLRAASADGLSLVGSGMTEVTTAPIFASHQEIRLTGAARPSAMADDTGRLTFSVDLGPAHTVEQYTAAGRVAAAQPRYLTNQRVTFRPVGRPERHAPPFGHPTDTGAGSVPAPGARRD